MAAGRTGEPLISATSRTAARNLQAHTTSRDQLISTGSETDSVPQPTSQIGVVRDKSTACEPDHACHLADAYGSSASRVDLTADRKDALIVDHVSHDDPASNVERQA
jgi:hypothetical protein